MSVQFLALHFLQHSYTLRNIRSKRQFRIVEDTEAETAADSVTHEEKAMRYPSFVRLASVMFAILVLPSSNAGADEIVLGQVAPLTGVIAETGNEYVGGAHAYFESINAGGGVNGRKIRVVVKDDGYKPDQTLKLTKEILDKDKPVALFGFVGTGNVLALLKENVLGNAGIALLAPYTGAEDLRNPMNPNLFHIRASYSDEAAKMVEHLITVGVKRVAVMYQGDPMGKSGLAGAEAALKKHDLKPVALADYDRTKPEEVDKAVAVIAAAKPDAVILVAINRASSAFITKLRAANSNAQMFSISVVNFKELLKNLGEQNARGIGIAQVMPFPYAESSPVVREYQVLMKKYSPKTVISYASMEGFIAAKVMVDALRRAGPKAPTRERVLKALEDTRDLDVGGFKVGFSPTNRVGSKFVEITVIGRNGALMR
jgi:branched-chain amino acid transport system substrate-binding protein